MNASEHPAVRAMRRPSKSIAGPALSADTAWRLGHIDAVTAYLAGEARPAEAAILHLLDALDAFARVQDGQPDNYRTPILGAMLDALGDLMNYDLGRLDAGTLDEWASRIALRLSWDRNLSEIIWPGETT